MPIPVVLSDFGIPVRAVEGHAPVMQVASSGIPIRISDRGVPFVVLGLEPVGQPPVLTSAPTVAPSSGPVGTVFTITPGSYTSETPITRLGQLRQNGAVVATRTGAAPFNFTSTSFGPLVWTETASNETGSAEPASASAIIQKQLQEFYDSGTIGIHLRTDGVTPVGGPATAIANEGGAGAPFNATVVGNPLPVNGNFLQATLSTGYPLTANPADIVGVRLIWVAQPASATGTYRYFGQNEAVNTNIRINNGTTLNLISNRTGSNVTVVIGGIPSSAAARIFEIEMTATEARLWVNGTMIGTATHPWTAFNIRSLTQGNSPTTQLFEGQLGDVLGVVSGRGDTDRAIAAARYYLDQRFSLGLGFPAPAPAPVGPTSVVVIGASHEEAMFGRSLSTPDADATSQLAALGRNIPVYGYATGGARLTAARSHYEAARQAFPNALIVSQFGGNNVSDNRPYPGGTSAFNAGLADLLAASTNDARYYPASMTFRDYNDTTFQTPANGSKPYNENLLFPWIATNFPHAIGAAGRPKIDLYRRVLADFENMLDVDNIHFTPAGYAALKSFYIARIADILNGVTPAEIPERVYDGPPPPLQSVNLTTAGGTAAYTTGRFGQAMNSNGTFYARADRSLTPLTPAWGVEAWVRIPTVSRSNIFWGESGSAVYGLVRASGASPAGVACIAYAGTTGTIQLSGGPRIDNNAWHHVAVQFRSNGADLFVDGALVASSTTPISDTRLRDGAGTSNDSRFTVGHYASTTQFIWSGQVDEVRIWDGLVLTAAFTPRTEAYGTLPSGTVAYWALDGNLNGATS